MIDKNRNFRRVDDFIGRRLRERRIQLGLTLIYVADKIGVSHQQIQKYEQGQTRVSAPVLFRFSKLYGVKSHYFFQGLVEENNETHDPFPQHEHLSIMVLCDDLVWEMKLRQTIASTNERVDLFFVRNTAQAITTLRNKNGVPEYYRPDIILLDLDSIKKEGLTFLREVKRERDLMDIPFMVISSIISNSIIKLFYSCHASGYISKNNDDFDSHIQSLVYYWAHCTVLPHLQSGEALMSEEQIMEQIGGNICMACA